MGTRRASESGTPSITLFCMARTAAEAAPGCLKYTALDGSEGGRLRGGGVDETDVVDGAEGSEETYDGVLVETVGESLEEDAGGGGFEWLIGLGGLVGAELLVVGVVGVEGLSGGLVNGLLIGELVHGLLSGGLVHGLLEGNEGPDAGEFLSAGIDSEEMSELAPNLEDEAGEQAKLEGTRLDVSVALAGEYASSMAKLLEQTTVFDPLQLGEGEAARDGNLTLLATEDGEYVSYEDLCRQHMEQFLRGVEQFTRETKLAKRVNE